jgi:hypothetical protein
MDIRTEDIHKDRVDERTVSYIVFESALARSERTIKRLIIALIMTIIFLFLSNAYWVYQWNQYDYETISYAQDGTGLNSINLGRQGDVRYEPSPYYSTETQEEAPGN